MKDNAFKQLYQHLIQYLCPPGEGVFTVHTAQSQRHTLQQMLYGTIDRQAVRRKWEQTLRYLPDVEDPLLLGVCSDNGGGILRGANWGPLFLRQAVYAHQAIPIFDLGDIRVIPHLLLDEYTSVHTLEKCRKALYGEEQSQLPVAPLSVTMQALNEIYACFPRQKIIGLGGDHSVSYSLIKPYLAAKQRLGHQIAVIHFDAHTDLLAERLGIEICFGSWAYHILPLLTHPSLLVQIGIRSSGHDRGYWESTLGVTQYWADEINKEDSIWLKSLINSLQQQQVKELYITVDIDVLDATLASATGTPETGGLTSLQVVSIIEELSHHFIIGGADLMEVAPFITGGNPYEPESTLVHGAVIIECLVRAFLDTRY